MQLQTSFTCLPGVVPGQEETAAACLSATPAALWMQRDVLAAYYARRAPEMEEAYSIAERQLDLQRLRPRLRRLAVGHDVLEVACGTGYWTQVMAATARSILATDINEEMLSLAHRKRYGPARVDLLRADAWNLDALPRRFTAAAALFWWSHIPKTELRVFLEQLHRKLIPPARVLFVDNLPGDCRWTPPARIDAEGNTFQRRVLRSGEEFEVMKNYPAEAELRAAVAGMSGEVEYTSLGCLWVLTYKANVL